jgi:gamma-glutamyltranspeptidase/glutathione hydrolase
LEGLGHNSADYIHYVAEAVKLAFSGRERYYGDPRFVDVDLHWLLSDEHADELRGKISREAASACPPSTSGYQPPRPADTTYVCTIDAHGNAFSATPSDVLEGCPIVPELGIIVSPRGVQSRLNPAHPSSLAPGKRPRLTPSPAVAISPRAGSESVVWAFGSPGGDVILQAMLQVFLNCAQFGMTPQQGVEAPRIASFSFPDSFFPHTELHGYLGIEARIQEPICDDLAKRGHKVHMWPEYAFDAGAVSLAVDLDGSFDHGRVLEAGADPRRNCYAVGR